MVVAAAKCRISFKACNGSASMFRFGHDEQRCNKDLHKHLQRRVAESPRQSRKGSTGFVHAQLSPVNPTPKLNAKPKTLNP